MTAGTATTGTDFVAASGTLSFNAGEATQTIPVQVLGDTDSEPNETFFVTLSNPVGATLGTASATGTIIDDELPVRQRFVGFECFKHGEAILTVFQSLPADYSHFNDSRKRT